MREEGGLCRLYLLYLPTYITDMAYKSMTYRGMSLKREEHGGLYY